MGDRVTTCKGTLERSLVVDACPDGGDSRKSLNLERQRATVDAPGDENAFMAGGRERRRKMAADESRSAGNGDAHGISIGRGFYNRRSLALLDRAIVRVLPAVPRRIVRKISARYIAGTDVEDACRVVKQLNAEGKMATIDVLGEEISTRRETLEIVRAYHDVFEAIERERLDSNVSVKLTALGLNLAYELCRANLEKVVRHAAESGNFVRIDMEDSSCTSDTLSLYRELRGQGLDNVGIVLQAYLRRTIRDIRALAPLRPNVRLCKGIYIEPPLIAYRDFDAVRQNFVLSLRELLRGGSYVGIATHDRWLISEGLRLVQEHRLTREQYEFQMLLGVTEHAANRLVLNGHRLRVYVPFGEHWYGYSVRRLQENPKIAGYIASDTLNRLFGADGRL
jgi:proline dehydrogenase